MLTRARIVIIDVDAHCVVLKHAFILLLLTRLVCIITCALSKLDQKSKVLKRLTFERLSC